MKQDSKVIYNSFNQLGKAYSMSNEQILIETIKRIEAKLDTLLALKSVEGVVEKKAPRVRKHNTTFENENAILTVLQSNGKPKHVLQLATEIEEQKLTTFSMSEASVSLTATKLANAGRIIKVRKGVYQATSAAIRLGETEEVV